MFPRPLNNIVILEQQRPLFGNRQQFTIYQLLPPGASILQCKHYNSYGISPCPTCDSISTFPLIFISSLSIHPRVKHNPECHHLRELSFPSLCLTPTSSSSDRPVCYCCCCHRKPNSPKYGQIFWFAFITGRRDDGGARRAATDTRFSRLSRGLCSTNSS